MVHELGEVLCFDILDWRAFVAAALELQGVTHFAATGNPPLPRRWPSGLTSAIEAHRVERPEVMSYQTAGFRVDARTRRALRSIFGPPRPWRWLFFHFWLYSDDEMLVSCYDNWDGPNFLHPSLGDWGRGLESSGVIRLTGTNVFTTEWYDSVC